MTDQPRYADVPIATLTEHPDNPRQGDVGAISQSIETNGFYGAIVAQTSTGRVLAGNHRLKALRALGRDTAPVVWADVDDATARRILLADNRANDLAAYDDAALAVLLRVVLDDAGTLDGTLYEADDLDALLADLAPPPTSAATDDAPEPPANPKTRPGDVFDLGPHRLVCGDSTDPAVLALLMADGHADVLWTDPPYGVDYGHRSTKHEQIDGDSERGLDALLRQAFAAADGVMADGSRFYIASAPGRNETTFRLAINAVGWRLHQSLVWVKDAFVLGASDYHYQHETILYGHKSAPGHLNRFAKGAWWYGGHDQSTVMQVDRPRRSESHPTMKPVDLIVPCLRNSAPPAGVVLDVFGGSGSTLVAADSLSLRARLVELDPAYCDVIRQRYADHADRPDLAP